MQRFEFRRRLIELERLVIRQAQVEMKLRRDLGRGGLQCRLILSDGFLIPAQLNQDRAQVRPSLRPFRLRCNANLVLPGGRCVVTSLVQLDCSLENTPSGWCLAPKSQSQ